jgi:hypothetical protein
VADSDGAALNAAISRFVGREDSNVFGSDHLEQQRWIGKPWRRINLLTNRTYWKGEQVDVTRDLSFHIGFRRLGLFLTFSVARQVGFDYSDEPNV